jgi:protein TonB
VREEGGAEYGAYLSGLRQRIQASLRYPPAARRRGLEGTVHVEIVITPGGAVGPITILKPSSSTLLDDAALEALRRLPPQPFPPDVAPRTLRVRLPIVFRLE